MEMLGWVVVLDAGGAVDDEVVEDVADGVPPPHAAKRSAMAPSAVIATRRLGRDCTLFIAIPPVARRSRAAAAQSVYA